MNNSIFNYIKIKRLFRVYFFVIFCYLLVSCHKSPGAICIDGHRSYSTGCGTCSWHGGVDHYINTDEISIPKTIGFIIFVGLGFVIIFAKIRDKN